MDFKRELRKLKALQHYLNMIKWVKMTRKLECYPRSSVMQEAIGECWVSDYCSYCLEYDGECRECELSIPDCHECENVDSDECDRFCGKTCCGGLWWKINTAKTWQEWLDAAWEIYDYIAKHG